MVGWLGRQWYAHPTRVQVLDLKLVLVFSQNDVTAQSLDWKPGARIFLELFKAFRRCALNDTRRPVDHKDVCDNFVVLKMMYRLGLWT